MKKLIAASLLCLLVAAFPARGQEKSPCPIIEIKGPDEAPAGGVPITLDVTVDGREPDARQTINWTLSAGKIARGQGTRSIEINTDGLLFYCLNVSVEMKGPKDECPHVANWASLVGMCCADPQKFDQYGNLSFEEEQARLDNVALKLKEQPDARVRIIGYDGGDLPEGTGVERANRAKDYLVNTRGVEFDRVVIGPKHPESGVTFLEEFALEFWIEPLKERSVEPCQVKSNEN